MVSFKKDIYWGNKWLLFEYNIYHTIIAVSKVNAMIYIIASREVQWILYFEGS